MIMIRFSENAGVDSQETLRLDCLINFQKLEHFRIQLSGYTNEIWWLALMKCRSFAVNEFFELFVATCPVLLRLKTCSVEFLKY